MSYVCVECKISLMGANTFHGMLPEYVASFGHIQAMTDTLYMQCQQCNTGSDLLHKDRHAIACSRDWGSTTPFIHNNLVM